MAACNGRALSAASACFRKRCSPGIQDLISDAKMWFLPYTLLASQQCSRHRSHPRHIKALVWTC
jgi:hypothetical protein